MLLEPKITAFIPTTLPEKSKQFYKDVLGLQIISEDDYAIEFKGNNALLRITIVPKLMPQPFTVLGFIVVKINSQVIALSNKGVEFEKYDNFDQNDLGIWTSPSKAKVAWFKDPDGNLLSLTEYFE